MKILAASLLCLAAAALLLDAAPVLSSTMSLTESDSAYTVKIGVPEKTPVNVRLAGRRLLLETGAADNAPRYEQSLQLPAALPDAPLGIQRDSGELVITIPKGGPDPASASAPDPFRDAFRGLDDFDAMRDDMLKQAAALMNQFGQATKSPAEGGTSGMDVLQSLLGQSGLAGVIGGGAGGFELREETDRYILSAKIPEAQAKNVSVNVDNDRFVTITTKQDKSSQTGGLSAFSASSSTQSMTLPGPVKVERMTMDYKNGRLEVTLPKA
jgi:HSP20 family molecular chaperone IbpA